MTTAPRPAPGTVVLHLDGDVDFFTEDRFRAQAERLLATEGIQRFVVDLSAVQMLDSSGLSLLVDLLKLCREMGLPMVLREVPERVRQVLDLTGLAAILPDDRTPESA